jgi:acyl carrier protein
MIIAMEQLTEEIIRGNVRNFLIDSSGIESFRDDEDFFASGVVNSLFAIELMTYIERSFGVKITLSDLDMDNFKTIENISTFINKKKQQNA